MQMLVVVVSIRVGITNINLILQFLRWSDKHILIVMCDYDSHRP